MKEIASEKIGEYLECMKDHGYRASYISLVRCTLNRYEIASGGKYDETTIARVCEKAFRNIAREHDSVLYVRKYADWLDTGEMQKKKPGKTGCSRPHNCRRICRYNSAGLCVYRPGQDLKKMPNPRTCEYFEEKVQEQEAARKALYWDNLYGRPASYLDSHSAMWT